MNASAHHRLRSRTGQPTLSAPQPRLSCAVPTAHYAAFTLVELLVVITVIVLVLALAVPGLSALSSETRLSSSMQTLSGVLTRAYYLAVAERTMTAVRFMPGEWDVAGQGYARPAKGRQHAVIYHYVATSSADPTNVSNVAFGEYFERAPGIAPVELPEDIWVAPLEALSTGAVTLTSGSFSMPYANFGRDFVLNGQPTVDGSKFAYDPDRTSAGSDPNAGTFLNSDDFLIVFDPQSGLVGGAPQLFRLKAYSPMLGVQYDTDRNPPGSLTPSSWFQRYNFTGVVIYRRETLLALPPTASDIGAQRQTMLRERGRPYMAHRFSGGLLAGSEGAR